MSSDSIYKKYANTSIDWCPMDTKELYEKNLKNQYDELKINGWIENKVIYQFNNLGFRCPNFSPKNNIMFLGCSHTMGIGINIEDSWSYHVANALNLNYINLGQGAGSNDTAFRLAWYWIPIIKPKIVFFLQTEDSRLELITKFNNIQFLTVGLTPPHIMFEKQWNKYYNDWISNDTNSYLNLQKNTLAISELCKQHKVKFRYIHSNKFENIDKARDLAHAGVASNKKFVSTVLSLIEDPNAHILKI